MRSRSACSGGRHRVSSNRAIGMTQMKPTYLKPAAPTTPPPIKPAGHAVPVQELAQFDADVGDDAGHVGGADLRGRYLADQRVLQPHGEGQHQHREGHGKRRLPAQRGAHQAEQQQQHRLHQQRQRVFAAQAVLARPVHLDGGEGGAAGEGQQGADRAQYQAHIAQHQVVGQQRGKAGHVRGVHVHHQKAARIDGAGIEGQHGAQQPVGGRRAVLAGQVAQTSHALR